VCSVARQNNEHQHFLSAFLSSQRHPRRMPAQVNDWDTPLPADGPGAVPVVLIHGTWMNSYCTWSLIAPTLAAAGHRVFAFNYGQDRSCFLGRRPACFGNAGLREAQPEVADFIDRVLATTGATQVDLVGHSQGVAQARMYLTDSGGAGDAAAGVPPKVRRLVGLAGSNHGTTASGIGTLGAWLKRRGWYGPLHSLLGQCAEDQMVGSEAMAHINRDGDTVPGVDYTMICSRYDEIVTPWRTQRLEEGEGASVTNVLVQEHGNRFDFSEHLALLYSPRALDLLREALDHGSRGDYRAATPHVHGAVLPLWGGVRRPRVNA
jgi:triacylglycerol lipase